MNSPYRFFLSPGRPRLFIILLAGVLISCTPVLPPPVNPPLSTIRVVMDNNYPPYAFLDNQGQVQGILVDQWKLWEERTGVKVNITALPWGEALQRMRAGEFDVIDTIFYTEGRAQDFDFTPSFARIDVPIFFQNHVSGIANTGNLKGFRVAVKSGDDNATYLISQGITDLVYYNGYEEIVKAAARGDEAIFVIDQPPVLYFLYKYGLQDQFNYSAPIRSGEFHRAVKKGNTAVLNLVTDGFSRVSSAEYQAINQRWMGIGEANSFQQLAPYLGAGVASVLLITFILFVFNRTLQKRVGQRTQQLEETTKALEESEEIFRLFMEHSPIYVFFKDEQTRSIRLSKNYEQMLGRPLSELLGKTMDELFPSELAKSMIADDLRILSEGKQIDVVEELNGRVYKTTKFPIMRQGRPRWLAGYTIDITEQVRAEEALRRSEDKFSKAFHTSPDSVNINRLTDGLFIEINQGFTAQTGYIAEDVKGKTSRDINIWVDPVDRARLVQELREHGQLTNLEALFRKKDGRIITGLMSAGIIEVGGEKCILSITRDITERKQAEEEIASLSRFPGENPNPVLRLNRDGDILYANEASQMLLRAWASSTGDVALAYWRRLAIETLADRANRSVDVECDRQVFSFSVVPILEAGYVNLYGRDITERKQAEEALRDSEEKFRAMIEEASEGFVLIDERGFVIECNRAQEHIWGFTHEEVLGQPAYDVQFQMMTPDRRTPERYENLKAMMLEALRTGQSPLFNRLVEAELYRPDGQQVVIQQSVFPMKTAHGYRLGSMSLDITTRKRAEAAVQASEQRMRAIVEAAPFGAHLYELEPNGRLVFRGFNPSADQILHVDHRQFVGKTIEEAFPPLGETEIPTAYRHVAATGERYQQDQIAYDDAGIRGAYELHAFQTSLNQMAVFFRDITERMQMEEALRISLEKYRVLFEAFPLGISITDSAGKIVESNLQAEQLLGVPKQEHERRTYDAPEWKIFRSDGTPMLVDEYASTRALRENRLIQNVEMGIMKDRGAIAWLSVTAAPIPLKGYGVAVTYGDITRRKEIEDEIRRLNEDLEQRVADRTRELAEANARLTELDQLKSKFVSDVSHELRTPIANLKLYIDLLERGKPEKQSHYITVLQQQVRRVAALVDDILDLSRLERRKEQGVTYWAVALNEVVEQVVLAHQPRAEADGLALTFVPAAHLPAVRGDANQLAQVITNLVANALSYTAAGYIRVSTYSQDNQVCLCVEDSGSGIPAEDQPHIFERFYRGRFVLKNDTPGTGLGLAIVKEIVELHQGRIEVNSRPNQGATFRVWLPMEPNTP